MGVGNNHFVMGVHSCRWICDVVAFGHGKRKNDIRSMIDQKALTPYIPVQIKITLENALKKYAVCENIYTR